MTLGITWVRVRSQARGRVKVDEPMNYSLSPVPFSLGAADDYMGKPSNLVLMGFGISRKNTINSFKC